MSRKNNICKFVVILFYCSLHTTSVVGQGPDCTGQTLGEQNPSVATATAGGSTDTSYLLRGPAMAIPCCGVVSQWSFAAATTGDVTAQVWKNTGGDTYEVAGEKSITVSSTGVTTETMTTDKISVEQGYVFGWYTAGSEIIPSETDTDYSMGIVSSSGKTAAAGSNTWSSTLTDGERWHFGVTVSANSVPYFTSLPNSTTISTADAVGNPLFTLAPTDDDPDDVAGLTVALNAASASGFTLAGSDIETSSTLSAGVYEVIVEVADHCLKTATSTLTVTVTDVGPDITSLPVAAPYDLREDTEEETLVHDIVYTDLDTDLADVTCSFNSTTPSPAPFHLTHKTGSTDYGVYFIPDNGNHLDYDVTPTYYIDLVCNDGTTDSTVELFQVDIVPNETPVVTIPASIDVSALNTGAGEVVYTVTATDTYTHPDGLTDTLTFTMDNCSCPFQMTADGAIYATEDLNPHRTSPYVVNITVTDSYQGYQYNTVGPTQMTIHIIDINTPPNITYPTETAPNIQTVYVKEHTEAEDLGENLVGTVISAFTVDGFDDDGDTITWEMEFTNGKGEILFTYDSTTGEISSAQDLDYELLSDEGLLTTTVDVRAYDGREYSETRTLNIVVQDENEIPVFDQDLYAIETTEGTDTTVTLDCPLMTVTEEDFYDTRDYHLDCDTVGYIQVASSRTASCDAIFEQIQEYDLDNPGAASAVITCLITVTDKGGLTATTTLEVTVHEEDDNPPELNEGSYTYTITNDTTAGIRFGAFSSEDDDFLPEHELHTYFTDSSEFGVDANGVFVSTRDWTTVNAPTSRTFTLYARDEAGHLDSAEVTVFIEDVPPTTTTTTSATTLPSVYDAIGSSLDDPSNLAWIIPAILLGTLLLGLLGFMCFRCCMSPGACFNTCRAGRCFRGGAGRRGFFGRRSFFNRVRQPRRVVKQPKPVRVVEKHRPMRVVEKGRPIRVVEEPRPVKVIEEPPHVKTPESKPAVHEPAKAIEKPDTPNKKTSFFNMFKKKPESQPVPDKAVDEPKKFHLWGKDDFGTQQKWVG